MYRRLTSCYTKPARLPSIGHNGKPPQTGKPAQNKDDKRCCGSHRHQAAERNALKVVAFQQLDDRVIAQRLIVTHGATKLQPTGRAGPKAVPMRSWLFMYQIAVWSVPGLNST